MGEFWRATYLFKLLKPNLCDNLRINLSGHSLCCFLTLLYLYYNCLISFFVLSSTKNLLCLIIESVSCFRLLSVFLVKLRWIVLSSVIITSFLSPMWTPIIIRAWLNCCKGFLWFHCANTKYIILAWFHFLVYLLFPAFISANNTGSLINNLFGVKIFIPFSSFNSSSPFSVLLSNSSSANHQS